MKRPHSKEKVLILQRNAEQRAKCAGRGEQKARNEKRKSQKIPKSSAKKRRPENFHRKLIQNARYKKQIILPEHLDLEHSSNEIIKAAKRIRDLSYDYINFDAVKNVSASAALVLAAELDVHRRNTPHATTMAYDKGWNQEVRRQLIEMGFLDLLHTKSQLPKSQSTSGQKVFIQFISGTELNGKDVTDAIANVEQSGKMGKLAGEIRLPLYAAISESITNTFQHAYGEERGAPGNRWWISASVSKKTKEINMVCYDRGRTIPVTIRKSKDKMERLGLFFQELDLLLQDKDKNKDDEILLATIRHEESSTRQYFRGKGLKNLRDLIILNGQGTLTIYSGQGVVKYTKAHGEEPVYSSKLLPEKIQGTLVECSIPHGSDLNRTSEN